MSSNEFDNYMISYDNTLKVINHKINNAKQIIDEYEGYAAISRKADLSKYSIILASIIISIVLQLFSYSYTSVFSSIDFLAKLAISYSLSNIVGNIVANTYTKYKLGMSSKELECLLNKELDYYLNNKYICANENSKLLHLLDEKNSYIEKYNENIINNINNKEIENFELKENNKEKVLVRM